MSEFCDGSDSPRAAADEPVAVVGMACRLPGADGPEAFWRLLVQARDAVGPVPAGRWTDAGPGADEYPARGGFLADVEGFDAGFFGISPREADGMDPQQRLVLELAWEAFEDAGWVPGRDGADEAPGADGATAAAPGSAKRAAGGRTAVVVGAAADDYAGLVARANAAADRFTLTGLHRGVLANRVSHFLGLTGPSLAVDTGQSSSLVAVHLAADLLRRGEAGQALVAGVSLNLSAEGTRRTARFGALSPHGRIRTFDAEADGYVRGEGGVALLLKPLSCALRDGDTVYSVLRGSACGNDGGGRSLTTPRAEGQTAVVRAALRRSGVEAAAVRYVELHGTGTRVGDPVEAAALGAVFGDCDEPLLVGSVKTNIGHLEAAAGLTGLLKTVLALHHRELPATLHHDTPNPDIAWDRVNLRVVTGRRGWPASDVSDAPLVAGVSSFGMGGTNCHVVVEEAPVRESVPADASPPRAGWPVVPLPVSAKSAEALRGQAERLCAVLADRPDLGAADLVRPLVATRSLFDHRAVVLAGPSTNADTAGIAETAGTAESANVGADVAAAAAAANPAEADAGLADLAAGRLSARVIQGHAVARRRTAFLFGGQGSQRPGMGRELYAASPEFAEAFDQVCAAFDPHLDRRLREIVFCDAGSAEAALLDQTAYTQPALFALEAALYRAIAAWGMRPEFAVGHSIGELAAVHAAGALRLDDAARLVAARGALMQAVDVPGAMVAVRGAEAEILPLLAGRAGALDLAAVNGPDSVVVSGDRDAVHEFADSWRAQGRECKILAVSHAFHSAHMDQAAQQLSAVARDVEFAEPAFPVVSNLTGRPLSRQDLSEPGYWADHMRHAVRFLDGVRALADLGADAFLELAPDGALSALTRGTLGPATITASLLRRDRSEPDTFIRALAQLHVSGVEVDWRAAVPEAAAGPAVKLPTYAFQRRPHWFDGRYADDQAGPAPTPVAAAGADQAAADVLDIVRTVVALVLGHAGAGAVDPSRTFKDLGMDSLGAVEFAARLATATGRDVPSSVVFDHPTPAAVAAAVAGFPATDTEAIVETEAAHDHHAAQSDRARTPSSARPASAADPGPIAIVGMACRYPGGVTSAEDLWRLVSDGVDAVSEFPADRGWRIEDLYDPEPGEPGKTYVRSGGFLYDAGDFDAAFFGISPREAEAMDPQQRLLLECAWEAVEDAGLDPLALRGSRTGVFAGVTAQEYGPRMAEPAGGLGGFLLTGTTPSVASGRVAYTMGWEGPAVTVDTACSSSLVAVHLAAQALRLGECDLAVAGGATVLASPGMFVEFARQRGLAPDGRCKPFAAAADGTGWGEGVGVVFLERLSDAVRNGRRILGVIRGSAVNSDGASNGLTAPNGLAQQRVIRQALERSGLTAADIDVVEAHGTGTALGDPIEARALIACYGPAHTRQRPLLLGSVKANIGHTQAAAGVAGLIKSVQALRHGTVPRTLHLDAPSPHVDWSAGSVLPSAENTAWPQTGRVRRAAVSSFGVSGTNAHLIVEQWQDEQPQDEPVDDLDAGPDQEQQHLDTRPLPFLLSARSESALSAQAERLLARQPRAEPAALAAALAGRRARLDCRAVVLAADSSELRAGLCALAEGTPSADVVQDRAVPVGKTAFVFPGQGAQWVGMAASLMAESPVFAAQLRACADALAPHTDWSLLDVLGPDADPAVLDRVDVVQPALFAVMVSLAEVWRSFGVEPDAVVGHSQGEIAAACVAGALSLQDAAAVVALRSKALVELAGGGGMASVQASAADVEALIERIAPERLSVAAFNGPEATVVSGDPDALEQLAAAAETEGVRVRILPVDYASHSRHVEPIRDRLLDLLADISPRTSRVPFVSTVTGEVLDTARLDAGYWFTNIRQTVRFEPAIRTLLGSGHGVFIEVGPHPVLAGAVQDTAEAVHAKSEDAQPVVSVGSLRRDDGGWRRFLASVAEAETRGLAVDWSAALGQTRSGFVELPTYPFQRQRYWYREEQRIPVAPDPAEVLRHRPAWAPIPVPAARRTGMWLVARAADEGDQAVLADLVRGALERRGADVRDLIVDSGHAERAGVAEAVRKACGDAPLSGFVSLLAFDESAPAGRPAVPNGFAADLVVLQALGDLDASTRLWCVTGDPVRQPAQALVAGLGSVAAAEYPRLWGGVVQLSDGLDPRGAEQLAAVLTGNHDETLVALRGGGVFARRLLPAPSPAARRSWRPTGTVLVTGGTGALGARVARWLASAGAPHLILLSRRGPDADGAQELREQLTALGARVTIEACDAADRAALAAVLAAVPADAPLSAVVHLAGLLDDGLLADLAPDRFQATLAAKAAAAWNLHELTAGSELSAFVLFSSITALIGGPGVGNYAPGNAYLDALAEHRRALGLPATAVLWGHWSGGGMGRGEVGERLRRGGIGHLAPEPALHALQQILDADESGLLVAELDWDRLLPRLSAGRLTPLVADLPAARAALVRTESLAAEPAGGSQVWTAQALLDLVRAHAAAVLGHADPALIGSDRAFKELGFDSLTAIELRNRLNGATALRLPSSVVFDHPSAAGLARHLGTLLGSTPGSPSGTEAAASAPATPAVLDDADPEDPVVIVGMACRFPGGVDSPEALWRLLEQERDVVTEFPDDRGWDVAGLYDPDPGKPGKSYTRHGGFLAGAADFDAAFFGISPREAQAMDPQQRLLMEVSWEALERSGIDPHSLRGSQAGVFAGVTVQDYGPRQHEAPAGFEGYLLTGRSLSVASGRIAYALGLHGPAVTIDTACSSTLSALHLAAHALRRGECSLALVGGVTVMPTPGMFVEFSRQRGLAPDGRCKPFAEAADGTAWSEGVGVVVVERLSAARRNGHEVLAVVRGSATNQDGASNGLTAPNGPSQQRVIGQALAAAGLGPDDVDAVEAHGTGTTLGDPIEAQALLAAYGSGRDEAHPLWLGSVKSNLGHTQAAAGAAALVKTVLALRHARLPRTLHVDAPSSHVDWSAGGVQLLTQARTWPDRGRPRRAGVSGFGISGTNVHVVLEQAPEVVAGASAGAGGLGDTATAQSLAASAGMVAAQSPASPEDAVTAQIPAGSQPTALPFVVSARTAAALADQASRLSAFLAETDARDADIAWSLAHTRAVFEHRAVVVADSRAGLSRGLDALAAGAEDAGVIRGTAQEGRTVFVFPGQGSQWQGMALELMDTSPVFAERIGECAAALSEFVDWSLLDALRGGPDAPSDERVDVVQPMLFAVMVSLAALWRAEGVEPDAVVGHSQGEIAAACVAGALSLRDAARIVALRSKALLAIAGRGGMVSVARSARQVPELLAPWADRIGVATVNGPGSVVVSGDDEALDALVAHCEAAGIRARRVAVDYASHSAHVEQIRTELLEALGPVQPREPDIPFYSTVTGELVESAALDAEYWYTNLRQPVLFEDACAALFASGHRFFAEVSPHPVLTVGIEETAFDRQVPAVVVGTLRRGEGGLGRFWTSAAVLFVGGARVDWRFGNASQGRRVDLPTYPFQHERHWLDAGPAGGSGRSAAGHPLLGTALELPDGGVVCTGVLASDSPRWLADHAVSGAVLLPGTAFVELAVRAGDEVGCGRLAELILHAPLVMPRRGGVQLRVMVAAPEETDSGGGHSLTIHSRPDGASADVPWTLHARGVLAQAMPAPVGELAAWPPAEAEELSADRLYEDMAAAGHDFGPAFRGARRLWRRGDEVFVEAVLPDEAGQDPDRYALHPALLDAALHGTFVLGDGTCRLPFALTGVSVHATGADRIRARVRLLRPGAFEITVADAEGRPVAAIGELELRPLTDGRLGDAEQAQWDDSLFRMPWEEIAPPPEPQAASTVAVFAFAPEAFDGPESSADPAGAEGSVAAADPVPDTAVPDTIVVPCFPAPAADERAESTADAVRDTVGTAVALIQRFLSEDRFAAARLVLVTCRAVAADPAEDVADLVSAPLWGLVRSTHTENPGRVAIIDIDDEALLRRPPAGKAMLHHAVTDGATDLAEPLKTALRIPEPQLAVRSARVLAPRLAAVQTADPLVPSRRVPAWCLGTRGGGTLDDLALLARPEALAPLEPGQVRVAVRAAGLNFRDVLIAVGIHRRDEYLGSEAAGVVTEVGPGVTGFVPGDRVLGMATHCIAPFVVADHRMLAPIPAGWSFDRAAGTPIAFLTAAYALGDLARLQAGDKVLIHSGAGGVGMAAVELARRTGAEVFATASPEKWDTLRALGLDEDHIASSRTLEFEARFLAATGGAGVDVVLNALARDFVDASLRLLVRGGRFVEMGKTDIRDAVQVAADHPGVRYQAFDLPEAGPQRIGELLADVVGRLERGELSPLPLRVWDVRRAREAFRFVSRARHVGKVVLTLPRGFDPEGTVLITGGLGTVGGLIARHLAAEHGVRRLVLAGRRAPESDAVLALKRDFADLGAEVDIVACDAADREQLTALLAAVPVAHPLTAVIHAAGVLDDGVLATLTADRVARVLRPKVDAALLLDELTREADLSAFIMFSGGAGVFGTAGQAHYAAANTFLDALAHHRRAAGRPAVSLAWGLWQTPSGMTGHLNQAALARLSRAGIARMPTEQGLALFDAARDAADPLLLPVRLDRSALTARAAAGELPGLLRGLVRSAPRRRTVAVAQSTDSPTGGLFARLAGMGRAERQTVLVELVCGHVATVLGHASAAAVDPHRPFSDAGFDSLTSVELRNRLNAGTGARLPASAVFDFPNPALLADRLLAELAPDPAASAGSALEHISTLTALLRELDPAELAGSQIPARLRELVAVCGPDQPADGADAAAVADRLAEASDDEIFAFIDDEL